MADDLDQLRQEADLLKNKIKVDLTVFYFMKKTAILFVKMILFIVLTIIAFSSITWLPAPSTD